MKKIILILLAFCFFSCKSEKKMVDTVVLEEAALENIAETLYKRHFTETNLDISEVEGDISKKEMRLLKHRLKCEEIYLIYETDPAKAPDSLVIFTRGGTWDNEHTVVVDMRKKPRAWLPNGLLKLTKRVHYRNLNATIPIS